MELHRGRLIDHIQLVVRDLPASRRFYDAVFKVLGLPIGGEADDYFWVDELFVSTADSKAAQGQLTGRHRQWRARRAPLSSRLLRRFPDRSGRQQYRGGLPRRSKAQRTLRDGHILGSTDSQTSKSSPVGEDTETCELAR